MTMRLNKNNDDMTIEEIKQAIQYNVVINDEWVLALCNTLVTKASKSHDCDSIAFAHVWLADHYYYVSYDLKHISEALSQAELYINEEVPSVLLEKFYTIKHLYYEDVFDEKSAFQYSLKALKIAEALDLKDRIAAHYGNIGDFNLKYHCIEEGIFYTTKAINTIHDSDNSNPRLLRLLLSNLITLLLEANCIIEAKVVIKELEELPIQDHDLKILVDSAYIAYYAHYNNKDKVILYYEDIMRQGLMKLPNHSYILEILTSTFHSMMLIQNRKEAKRLLELLETTIKDNEYYALLNLTKLKIKYAETYKIETILNDYYCEYYHQYLFVEEQIRALKVEGLKTKVALSELYLQQKQSHKKIEKLKTYVHRDELTGVYNRRFLNNKQSELLKEGKYHCMGYAIFDIDYFKEYNDFYGHLKGDKILTQVAQCLTKALSNHMMITRFGGDEFVCLCWQTSNKELKRYIDSVVKQLKALHLRHETSYCSDNVTLSIGYGCTKVINETEAHILFKHVDQALYKAKNAGRNTAIAISDSKLDERT